MFKKSMVIKWLAYIAHRQPRVERKLKFIKNIFLHKLSVNERQTCRQCFDIYFKYICLYKMDWGYSLWSLYWPCHELGMDMFQRLHIYSNMMGHLVLTAISSSWLEIRNSTNSPITLNYLTITPYTVTWQNNKTYH